VLAVLLVPVLEYDSDVPQFSPVLYLPVATAGTLLAFLMLRGAAPGAWPATTAAAAVMALRALTVLLLAGLNMTLTVVPPVLAAAVVDDILAQRRVGGTARAVVLSLVLPATWLPALALQGGTATRVPAGLVPQAVLFCVLAVVAVLLVTGRLRVRPASGRLAVPALFAVALPAALTGARPALAHDPGQGQPAGAARLIATRSGGTVRLVTHLNRPCAPTPDRAQVVGRRAGKTVRAAATATPAAGAACIYTGEVALAADGRWFLYLELDLSTNRAGRAGGTLETWVHLPAGSTAAAATKELYAPPPPTPGAGRNAVGALLYLAVAGLLVASVRLAQPEPVVA